MHTKACVRNGHDSQGSYLLRDLPLACTKFRCSQPLHEKHTSDLLVRAQEAIEVNIYLRLAAATENGRVTAEAMRASTESSSLAATVLNSPNQPRRQARNSRLRDYFPRRCSGNPLSRPTERTSHINWKFADNLTTWKLSLIASRSTAADDPGQEVKSFQPFFVEHDPPKVLTLGDRIFLPVVIRNYTDKSEQIK